MGFVAALLASPLLVAGFQLWRAGDYESQTYFWRSAPPGIDLAALALGNPLGVLNGGWTAAIYDRLLDRSHRERRLDRIRAAGRARLGHQAVAPAHGGPNAFSGLPACSSSGRSGRTCGCSASTPRIMLPQTILRFLPVVANARIPGRAFVVVQLMIAVLGAMALALPGGSPGAGRASRCWPSPR